MKKTDSMQAEAIPSTFISRATTKARAFFDLHREQDEAMAASTRKAAEFRLPSFLRAVKISGGESQCGHAVRGKGFVPRFAVTVGDLVLEDVEATPTSRFVPPLVFAALHGAAAGHPVLAPIEDPTLVLRLTTMARDQVVTLRDFMHATGVDYRYPDMIEGLVAEQVRVLVQDMRLEPNLAARTLEAAWSGGTTYDPNAPTRLSGQRYSQVRHPLPLVKGGIAFLACRLAKASEYFYTGETAALVAAELDGQRKATKQAETAEVTARAKREAIVKTTPRKQGLLVMRRPVPRALGPGSSFFHAGFELRAFARFLPADVAVPSTVAEEHNHTNPGASIAWVVVGDDEETELSAGEIARGRSSAAPDFLVRAIRARLHELVKSRAPVTDPIDMRRPVLFRERREALRTYLKELAALHMPLCASAGFAIQYGAVRLGLLPFLVATEINEVAGKSAWVSTLALTEEIKAIAADANCHIFDRLDVKGAV